MQKEYQTVHFPNTPEGQTQKITSLNSMSQSGWRVTSETITPGKFKGKKACCMFVICTPLAFCAGSTDGTINVTLERDVPTPGV